MTARNEPERSPVELPSIEQCRTFLATINRGREAIGLGALEKLDFDACEPGHGYNCLSARHVFEPGGYYVLRSVVEPSEHARPEVPRAMGLSSNEHGEFILTRDVLAVTDVFDARGGDPELLKALRERMVEAGVV